MVLTGTFSLTNWMNSRPLTGRHSSVKRNVRAHPTVTTAIASADDSFPEGGGSGGGDDNFNFENTNPSSTSSWRGTLSSWSFPGRNWPLVLRTVAFHATHITARLISQPFQPALEKFQQRAANSAAVKSACAAFQVDDLDSLQDVANALILSECVYKVVGRPEQEAVRIMSCLKSSFPPGIVTISSVQFARSHVRHRFAISQSDDALYVAFMGTKLPRDFIANAAAWQEEVQLDADTVVKINDAEKMALAGGDEKSTTNSTTYLQQAPAAHRGFLERARGIPIDSLFYEAQKRGKRLVLCGHSLGGAVATLTAIKLLQRLPPEQQSAVSCVGFATPALGNTALATMVKERQWHDRIINYLVPEDPIPRLLSVNPDRNTGLPDKLNGGSGSGNAAAAPAAASEDLPSQFDVVGNIAAVPGRILSLSRRSLQKQEQEPAALEMATAGVRHSDTLTELQPSEQSSASNPSSSSSSGPGIRRSISQGTLKMVNLATAPLRRPNYQPIGRQLFICEDAVKTERPAGTRNNSRSGSTSGGSTNDTNSAATDVLDSSNSNTNNSTGTSNNSVASTSSVGKSSEQKGLWWSKLPFSSSMVFLPTTGEGEGDDDNVDVAAATAAAGGIVSDRLPRRTLFPAHRMLTHRTRLLTICQGALSGHKYPKFLLPASSMFAALPHVPNFQHPDDIVLSELLAPGMFPLKADALVPSSVVVVQQQRNEQPHVVEDSLQQSTTIIPQITTSNNPSSKAPRVSLVGAARQKLTWPLRVLLGRPRQDSTDTSPVDVVVRIEGRGLCNVTAAWVSGGQVDANSGRATPIEAEILSMPRAPAPSQALLASNSNPKSTMRRESSLSLMEPVSALASWVAMAVGWVSLLRQLQKPSGSDYLLARVKLPASTVRAAHRAHSDPFAVAVGEGPRLMMHLQSDFAVHSLPLTVDIVDEEDESSGGGGRNNKKNKNEKMPRHKDANQFLRNAKSGLPHLY